MTTVTLYRREDGAFAGFRARGHAGYAEAGEDVVCAAVSALTQATDYGLSEVLGAVLERRLDERRADYSVRLADSNSADVCAQAQLLFRTLEGSLRSIAEDYPRFVRIISQERRETQCSR